LVRLSFITLILMLSHCNLAFAEAKPLHIALVGPFTGAYAAYGTQLLSGATQAINDLNKAGGIKGMNLEITPIDDQCNPDLALTQATKLIKDKHYQAVIGHVCSSTTLATSNIYAKDHMLVITPTSTNTKITERNIPTLFRMTGTDYTQSSVAANFIARNLNSSNVAILHDQELYSKSLADLVSEQLVRLGKAPVLYQAIPRGTHNFASIVKKLKALKVDALYFAGLYPEVSALAQALNSFQLQIPLISGDALALHKFVTAAGGPKIAQSVILSFGNNPKNLVSSQTVIHAMQEQHLETSGYSLYAYAAVQVIAKAIDSTNSTDGKTLANWLHHNEVDTVLGKKSWDTNGDIVEGGFKMYSWGGENAMELVALEF